MSIQHLKLPPDLSLFVLKWEEMEHTWPLKQLVSQLSKCIWTSEITGTSLLNPIIPVTLTAIFIWNPLN